MKSLIVLCIAIFAAQQANSATWNYDDIPDWAASFPLCNGQSQSPINLVVPCSCDSKGSKSSSSSKRSKSSKKGKKGKKDKKNKKGKKKSSSSSAKKYDLTLVRDDYADDTNILENNGYTIKMSFEPGRYTVSGKNLPSDYRVAQFHFHWGSTNEQGSEHTLNGVAFPIELHVVTYRLDFDSLGDAVASNEPDALAVFGFFFEVSEHDNEALKPVTYNIPNILTAGSTIPLYGYDLEALIEDAFEESYFRYSGSLTTPTCNEVVLWTVFDTPLKISEDQLQAFRSSTSFANTYRPTQLLNGREVIRVE